MPRSAESVEQQRQYRLDRYADYLRLCEEHGEESRGREWIAHLRELNNGARLTKEQMFAYWRERFTDREIFQVGGNL